MSEESASGQIKCNDCQKLFDVDSLEYNAIRERFCCPHCHSSQFRAELADGGPVQSDWSPSKAPLLPTSQELIKALALVTKELRREHMERPDRYCTSHCSQCLAIDQAETLLAAIK